MRMSYPLPWRCTRAASVPAVQPAAPLSALLPPFPSSLGPAAAMVKRRRVASTSAAAGTSNMNNPQSAVGAPQEVNTLGSRRCYCGLATPSATLTYISECLSTAPASGLCTVCKHGGSPQGREPVQVLYTRRVLQQRRTRVLSASGMTRDASRVQAVPA